MAQSPFALGFAGRRANVSDTPVGGDIETITRVIETIEIRNRLRRTALRDKRENLSTSLASRVWNCA